MLSYAVAVSLACLAMVSSREIMRPLPTITNSLVNLGKMEISFYFNDSSSHQLDRVARSMGPIVKPEPTPEREEACPCSSLRNVKDSFLNNPAGILNKILMNSDLFSSNKDPIISTSCCESHEETHIQEGTVVFELPANHHDLKPTGGRSNVLPVQTNTIPLPNNGMPMLPFLFDTLIPNKSMLSPLKTKSIEIFLFPNKKGTGSNDAEKNTKKEKKDLISKDNIQIVGDREIKNNISLFKPVFPVVKKDLTFQEKNEKLKAKELALERAKEKEAMDKEEVEQIIIEPANKPNAV